MVGERIELADHTIIPLCSVGFGFGAGRGGGSGKSPTGADDQARRDDGWGSGFGSGLGAGGGVRPVAAIVAGPDGVKVHALALEAGLNAERLAKLLTAKGDKETTE